MTPEPHITFEHAINIAADALPRRDFRAALVAAIRTDPEVREAVRSAVAAGRCPA